MFRTRSLKWIVCTIAMLLATAGVANADTWSSTSDCGCSGPSAPPAGQAFWMRPTPPYNTSWARVPVTNYRPQVVNDPMTGVSYTTTQPCNTYEMQMRRTPGCSLWQSIVNWWRSRCGCLCRRPASYSSAYCPPTNEWVVSSPETTSTPYYSPSTTTTPSTNGRLVPVPTNPPPTTAVPADRRPQLTPPPVRSNAEGSASRLISPDRAVFVHTLDAADDSLQLTPPLLTSGDSDEAIDQDDGLKRVPELIDALPGDHSASIIDPSLGLVPVSWTTPSTPEDSQLPTDVVWDDTGWRSEQ